MNEGDRRERIAGGRLSRVTAVSISRADGRLKSPAELREGLDSLSENEYRFKADFQGTFFEDFEAIHIDREVTITVIRRPKPQTVIERLRAANPTRHIVSVGIELDDPAKMEQFVFQYAEELKSSRSKEVSQHPLDTAKSRIIRVANHRGLPLAGRWHELFATGTVKEIPDHSLDWITKHHKPQTAEETTSHSLDNLQTDRELRYQMEDLYAAIKLDNIRSARKLAEERRALAKKERSMQPGAGLVEAERRLVDLGWMLDSPKINPSSPVTL